MYLYSMQKLKKQSLGIAFWDVFESILLVTSATGRFM
jgi:hypothetical protein